MTAIAQRSLSRPFARLRRAALPLSAALVLIGAGAVTAAPRPAAPTPVRILLDWTPNTDHTGLYAALARGDFRRAGVAPSIVVPSNPGAALEEVAAGKADFAVSYEPDVLLARAQGVPVVSVMALVDRPLNTILSLRSSGITSAADLRHKRIGITGVPSDYAVVDAVLAHAGIPRSQVTLVRVGYSLLPSLLRHRVDAVEGVYWTWEAVQLSQQGYKVNVLHLDKSGVPTYDELVLVTSTALAKNDAALVSRVVGVVQRGYAYAAAHPVAAGQDLLKETHGLSPSLVRASLRLLAPAFDTGVPTVGYQNAVAWNVYMRWMVRNHLLTRPVAIDQAMSDRFLRPHVGRA